MDSFDGRGLALGIVVGLFVGSFVSYFTQNGFWLTLFAAVGAIMGMNNSWFKSGGGKADQRGPDFTDNPSRPSAPGTDADAGSSTTGSGTTGSGTGTSGTGTDDPDSDPDTGQRNSSRR
jgi:uncharacterized membrane protein YfcA